MSSGEHVLTAGGKKFNQQTVTLTVVWDRGRRNERTQEVREIEEKTRKRGDFSFM